MPKQDGVYYGYRTSEGPEMSKARGYTPKPTIVWGSWDDGIGTDNMYDVVTSNADLQESQFFQRVYTGRGDPDRLNNDDTLSGQFWRHPTFASLKDAMSSKDQSRIDQARNARFQVLVNLLRNHGISTVRVRNLTNRAEFEGWFTGSTVAT